MFARHNAAQIRISLDDIEPEIWRRLVVPIDWNLQQLHLTIQAAFNWWNYHLHEFRIGGLRYGDVVAFEDGSCEGDPRVFNEHEVHLRDFMGPGTTFAYVYDFGDDWHHTVELEEFLSLEDIPKHGTCLDGGRARPPEDVGGVQGYEQFLEIIGNPKNPEHADTKRWCSGYFNPEWFDLLIVNKDVRNALKPDVKRRLHQPKPRKAKTSP
jgi:hypothetical protein